MKEVAVLKLYCFVSDVMSFRNCSRHHILKATQEHEIEQRDLYDRPPSVFKSWTDGNVALIGDAV